MVPAGTLLLTSFPLSDCSPAGGRDRRSGRGGGASRTCGTRPTVLGAYAQWTGVLTAAIVVDHMVIWFSPAC